MLRVLLVLWLCLAGLTATAARAEFAPPGLGNDTDAYVNTLLSKAPPQPQPANRDKALKDARAAVGRGDFPKAVAGFEQAIALGADGSPVGALQAQGLRTLWGASYDLLGPEQEARFTIRDDHPWLSVVEGAIGAVPFIGDLIAMGFDYLVNPTYTVTDAGGQPAYRVHKKRSFLSRRFTVQELQPRPGQDDELVLLGLIQLVLRERERG